MMTMNLRSPLSCTVRSQAQPQQESQKLSKTIKTRLLRPLKNHKNKNKSKVVGGSSESVTVLMIGVKRIKRHQMMWMFLQSNRQQKSLYLSLSMKKGMKLI